MSTAIVTGGSAGIGREIVRRLLEAGQEVISLDLKPTDLSRVRHVDVDLTDTAATAQAATEIASSHAVTAIVHNAVLGLPTRTSYSATKAGMLGMARTWALELAPLGITVNVVAPGPMQTANFHGIVPPGSPQVERIIQAIPVKRLGQP